LPQLSWRKPGLRGTQSTKITKCSSDVLLIIEKKYMDVKMRGT